MRRRRCVSGADRSPGTENSSSRDAADPSRIAQIATPSLSASTDPRDKACQRAGDRGGRHHQPTPCTMDPDLTEKAAESDKVRKRLTPPGPLQDHLSPWARWGFHPEAPRHLAGAGRRFRQTSGQTPRKELTRGRARPGNLTRQADVGCRREQMTRAPNA